MSSFVRMVGSCIFHIPTRRGREAEGSLRRLSLRMWMLWRSSTPGCIRGACNRPAHALAQAHGKLCGAGSDAHTLREVGGAWVEVPVHENHPAALLEALVHAQVKGRTAPVWIHLASTWAKVRKSLPG